MLICVCLYVCVCVCVCVCVWSYVCVCVMCVRTRVCVYDIKETLLHLGGEMNSIDEISAPRRVGNERAGERQILNSRIRRCLSSVIILKGTLQVEYTRPRAELIQSLMRQNYVKNIHLEIIVQEITHAPGSYRYYLQQI